MLHFSLVHIAHYGSCRGTVGQEQRDEGSQCPQRREPQGSQDESPIAQEEDAGEVKDKEGFESAPEEAGGARTV